MKNSNRIKRLVKSDCAGYFSENNYCCSKDGICVFFEECEQLPNCKYFEVGVLPLNADLEYEYRQEHQMAVVHKIPVKTNSKCGRCNLYFEAASNRQNYCEKCKKIVKREQSRLSMQKKRNKSA